MRRGLLAFLMVVASAACGARSGLDTEPIGSAPDAQAPPDASASDVTPSLQDFKVAFVGDQGVSVWRSKTHTKDLVSKVDFAPPCFTHDGALLAFTKVDPGYYIPSTVLLLDSAGQVVRSQKLPFESADPAPRPDGQRLAFTRIVAPSCLTTCDADGTCHQALCATTGRPVYAGDGDTLVFTEGGELGDRSIAVMRDDGADHQVIVPEDPSGASFADPSFSFDGKRVTFLRRGPSGAEVDVVDLGSLAVHVVTSDGPPRRSPQFTPDGQAIVYAVHRTVRRSIASVDLSTGIVSELVADIGGVTQIEDPPISVAPDAP